MKNLTSITIITLNLLCFPVQSESIFDLGKKIFVEKGNCISCHTLADANSIGQIGPNLNQIKPDKKVVLSAVSNGIGVMPSYYGILSSKEMEAVSHYVSVSAVQ